MTAPTTNRLVSQLSPEKVITEIKDKDGNVIRRRVQHFFTEKNPAKQSFKDQCDVNKMLAQYDKTGDPTPLRINDNAGQWGVDAPDAIDFKEAMDTVAEAKSMFEELPSKTRDFFENDPGKYLEFVNNPENSDAMVEMGLATRQNHDQPSIPVSPNRDEPVIETPTAQPGVSQETPSGAPNA